MQKKIHVPYNNMVTDSLSLYLKDFSFAPHAFGHQHDNKNNVCDFRVVSDFELIFVVGGQSIITIEQTIHQLNAGDILLIPPFTIHKIDTPPSNPHNNYWIHFDIFPVWRQNEFADLLSCGIQKWNLKAFSDILLPLLTQMEREIDTAGYGSGACFDALFLQLLVRLLQQSFDESTLHKWRTNATTAEKNIVARGMQFIQQNVEGPLCIADLCNALHISKSYLYKTYAKVINLSPNYLISLCKVKRAEQLLKTTNYSIKEISELLCFSSPYYFSTVFKNFYGMSPGKFISSLTQNGGEPL